MTPTRLCFIDTETTSLRPNREPWEIAIITRDVCVRLDYHWFIQVNIGNADPQSLTIGGFYDRHPTGRWLSGLDRSEAHASHVSDVAVSIMQATHGATLIGSNPSFDTGTIARLLAYEGHQPSWHYRLVDLPSIVAGHVGRPVGGLDACADALGLEWPDGWRHTALGDARMCELISDLVMERRAPAKGGAA